MNKLNKYLTAELYFVVLGLIFGSIFIKVNPPFHSNDEDRHFLYAYHIAENGLLPDLSPDKTKFGGPVPTNLTKVVASFQGVPYHIGQKMKRSDVENRKNVPLLEERTQFESNLMSKTFPVPYFHNALAIKIGKSINSNPVSLGYSARYGSLVLYLVCMFFIIRLMPVFKTTMMAFALTPMVLYQMTSVTYDVFNFIISFYFVALYLYYTFTPNAKLNIKSIILIVLLAILYNQTKAGYFLLPLIIVFIPKNKFDLKFNPLYAQIGLAAIFLLLYFNIPFVWRDWYMNAREGLIAGSQGFQNDFHKDMGLRLSNLLADPFTFIGNMWANLMHFKQNWAAGILGKFGYSYSELPQGFYIAQGVGLMLIAFLDGKKDVIINLKTKIGIGAVGIATFFLVIVGFYAMSPIGAEMIFGFQGRYLIPSIPFLLLLLYNNKIVIPKWEENKNMIVAIFMIIMLSFAVDKMYDLFYYAY